MNCWEIVFTLRVEDFPLGEKGSRDLSRLEFGWFVVVIVDVVVDVPPARGRGSLMRRYLGLWVFVDELAVREVFCLFRETKKYSVVLFFFPKRMGLRVTFGAALSIWST
ncbi:hypothetical protein N7G274_009563 [Stereocaulon virgatum]|uniref:Uncharacterized protein n=1 Tax=Stereocaulon virgatum TaxID=373712 RepID=A0ABR3ZWB7_9LECA